MLIIGNVNSNIFSDSCSDALLSEHQGTPAAMQRMSKWKDAALMALVMLGSVPALAQVLSAPPAKPTGSTNLQPNPPYDITADQQEVFNEQHRTVYRGNVVVIHGTDRLNTPQLTAISDKRDTPKTKSKPGTPGPVTTTDTFGKIKEMEAEGPVYFTTPTQNAKGDHGSYLASTNTITLTGNVVLVQNKDVSTGDKLVIDRTNDHYTLYKKNDPTGRVRGVFYQDEPANGQTQGPGKTAAPKPK